MARGTSLANALIGASWRGALLTAGGLALAFVYNAARAGGIPLKYQPPTTCSAELALPQVGVVAAEALAAECGNGNSIVIADARSAERFAMGHIVGAVHLPCSASDDDARARASRSETAAALSYRRSSRSSMRWASVDAAL